MALGNRQGICTWHFDGPNGECVSTMGVGTNTGAPAGVETTILNDWHAAMATLATPSLWAGWSFVKTTLNYRDNNGDQIVITKASPTVTGSGSSPAPPWTALIAQKRTLFGGRQNRGRMFLPGFLSDAGINDQGQVVAADLSVWDGRLATFLANLEDTAGGMYFPAILHTNPVLQPTRVVSLLASPTPGVVKSRRA